MQHYGIEIFKDLDQSFEQQFIQYGKIVSFKKKETPFLNGELHKYFYIVLKGKIKTFQLNPTRGDEIISKNFKSLTDIKTIYIQYYADSKLTGWLEKK